MPGPRLEIDAADHRPRADGLVRNLAGELEVIVCDEDNVVVAAAGCQQRRVVLLALARIGTDLELLLADDARAKLLGRSRKRIAHQRIGPQWALKNEIVAPLV